MHKNSSQQVLTNEVVKDYPKSDESPSSASSSFFSSFLSSSGGVVPAADGADAAEGAVPTVAADASGAAFRASSIFTSLRAATRAFTLTSSGVTPVAFITFAILSSVIFCFNLCNNKAAYTYSILKRLSNIYHNIKLSNIYSTFVLLATA